MERSCGKNPKRRTELAYSRLHFAVVAYYQSLCYHHATYLECFILLAVTLYLCVTWYNQGRVLFFSMELSAQQKKQAYHVCRLGKKWIENHGHALFFSFAFAIIVLPILLTNSYDFQIFQATIICRLSSLNSSDIYGSFAAKMTFKILKLLFFFLCERDALLLEERQM